MVDTSFKRGWNRNEGRGNKDFKKGEQARWRGGCLKKGGGGTGTQIQTISGDTSKITNKFFKLEPVL